MSEPTAAGNPLDQIIADYLQAAEAGRVPSRQALLDAHPEYAADLRAFFADYDRLDNRADALRLTVAARPPAERPKVRYFGDYELLEEIAEGGMGLVYKARQETLGRVVALKLVRAGRLARPIDLARFRIEAEAAAGLDHPNIVPLYEVGEHEGQQYLAMKFIDGPSLAKLPRGDVRAEVARLEAVARAVDFAHRQGILHRDIKPSNILTDSSGTPYVTDFGLAKRIDADHSLTESGQMLGTAGYIAPEQALGKKGLTVTADVFSLGAVLFERLTGTPAFPGGTILERLRSLQESVTPRPTMLMPALPRDLETVVLKCLQREPGKRYATAGLLVDDLARWLRGEPIMARRVTAAERFWLWCRRNPAVAVLTGAAAALLIAGTAVSSYFAVEANRRAAEAVQAKGDASRAQERAERILLRSLLQPIGYDRLHVAPAEHQAFFELAELAEDRLKLLFLEIALAEPDSALRVARRSEHIVQAVVGASERRRRAVLALAGDRQRDASADPRIRLGACWIAIELGSTDLPAAQEAWRWVNEHDIGLGSGQAFLPLLAFNDFSAEQISVLRGSIGPAELAYWQKEHDLRQVGNLKGLPVLDALTSLRPKTSNRSATDRAGDKPAALPALLDGAAATRAVTELINTFGKTNDLHELQAAGERLAALAKRMDSPEAFQTWERLVAILDRMAGANNDAVDGAVVAAVAQGLVSLARRLDEPAACRASERLVGMLNKLTAGEVLAAAADSLAAVAPRLDRPATIRAFQAVMSVIEGGEDSSKYLESAGVAALALAENASVSERRAFRARVGKAVVVALRRLDVPDVLDVQDETLFVLNQFESVIVAAIESGDFLEGTSLFSATTDLATIADCLRHPACVGSIRRMVLHRLEELAFPPPAGEKQQAVAESVVTGLMQPLAGGVLAAGRQLQWEERERKFRTTWDAVAWLNKHHPEIDLDKPYTPRK
jgi:tRNA A-37 threonylcarbamoyl transferase component Bud32